MDLKTRGSFERYQLKNLKLTFVQWFDISIVPKCENTSKSWNLNSKSSKT
jgi:hypothetical protein